MAGGWAIPAMLANPADLAGNTTFTTGAILTSGATAYTKGAWTQIIASTPADASEFLVQLNTTASPGYIFSFDIAIAPSGQEASGILIQNVVFASSVVDNVALRLPAGPIPAGSRIAARVLSSIASDAGIQMQIQAFASSFGGTGGFYDTYGGSTIYQGVQVDPGATPNTKGAWAQITPVGGTTNDLRGLILGFDFQGNEPTSYDRHQILFDLALGPSGSETSCILIPNLMLSHQINYDGYSYFYGIDPLFTPLLDFPIAAGTRIAVRAQASINTSPDRLFGVSLYGLRF